MKNVVDAAFGIVAILVTLVAVPDRVISIITDALERKTDREGRFVA